MEEEFVILFCFFLYFAIFVLKFFLLLGCTILSYYTLNFTFRYSYLGAALLLLFWWLYFD